MMNRRDAWAVVVLAVLQATPGVAQVPSGERFPEFVERARAGGEIRLDGRRIELGPHVFEVYRAGDVAPLWTDRSLVHLVEALEGLRADGLEPEHYHLATLRAAIAGADRVQRYHLDLVATSALSRAAQDLRAGRVGDAVHRATPMPPPPDPLRLRERIAAGEADRALTEARPDHFVYRGLVSALARLREVAAGGGWSRVPDGPLIRPGVTDARVPPLRARLRWEGGGAPAIDDMRFDPVLEAAVRSFQHRHGLNEDGIVGPATLAALNVPVEDRISQVRINLERARWVTHDLPRTFVVTNVAGAKVYLVREGDVVFETRAVVGRTRTETPVFRAPMRWIDLNPTWTVPTGIVDEVLAAARREPGYLERQGMRILDRAGRPVDPGSVDLGRSSAADFPYVFRQDPGPLNPLGRLKLMFPNPHDVYLHDTPERGLFERESRTFSHGCIRVQDPVGLAALVLDDPRWSRSAIEAGIAGGETVTIRLDAPIEVLVLYWTASADLHGELHFYQDVYQRDRALLDALDRP